jgi:hypothetical protein
MSKLPGTTWLRCRRGGAGKRQSGTLAVEAAFVLPVIITGAMMVMELAYVGFTVDIGSTALEHAVQQFRADASSSLEAGRAEPLIRERMVAASHGYLNDGNIASVNVESFASLDEMGGGTPVTQKSNSNVRAVPILRITVDIRKDFITPLPQLLSISNGAFRYRYQQLLGYLPTESSSQ